MGLTSITYLTFLSVLAFLYYVLPKKTQWILLLIASVLFITFATSDIRLYICVIYVVLVSFFGAKIISNTENKKKKKRIEIVVIILELFQLAFLKYLGFIVDTIQGILNFNLDVSKLSIVVSIGVSYYTLISIGYIIDVYRDKVKANTNLFKHILFLLYFPQITAGPLTRYPEMEKELYSEHKFNYRNICFGSQRILWGIFKKIVVSERLAVIANTIFDNYTQYSGLSIMIGAIAFTLQLYTDFSGCIDIVIGTSKIFGIKLPENFDTPFFSKTIPEFWRRWHMTLNEWLLDYLYIPLGGSRKGVVRTYINIMIVFIVSGLWHGAAWTFVIWGLLNGIYNCYYRLLDSSLKPALIKFRKILGLKEERKTYKIMQMLITFTLISFAFIFFRAETVGQACSMIKRMVTGELSLHIGNLGLVKNDYLIIIAGLASLLSVSLVKQKYDVSEVISRQHIVVRYMLWIILIFTILILGYYGEGYDAANFLYQKF